MIQAARNTINDLFNNKGEEVKLNGDFEFNYLMANDCNSVNALFMNNQLATFRRSIKIAAKKWQQTTATTQVLPPEPRRWSQSNGAYLLPIYINILILID